MVRSKPPVKKVRNEISKKAAKETRGVSKCRPTLPGPGQDPRGRNFVSLDSYLDKDNLSIHPYRI